MLRYVYLFCFAAVMFCGCFNGCSNGGLANTYTVKTADGRVFKGLRPWASSGSAYSYVDNTGRRYYFSGNYVAVQELAAEVGE